MDDHGGWPIPGIAGANPEVCMSFVNFVCCKLEVSGSGRSLVQRSLTKCGVLKCV